MLLGGDLTGVLVVRSLTKMWGSRACARATSPAIPP